MSVVTTVVVAIVNRLPMEGAHGIDDQGYTSHSWIWPEQAELIYGTIASVLIGLALFKVGRKPAAKAMQDRTDRIQAEMDEAASARAEAQAEADKIRSAVGDIDAERERMVAEADAQAGTLLAEGRQRLDAEAAELEARAEADLAAAASRTGDELRGEIARLSAVASERVVAESLDDATQQRLIEAFIARVGADAGASA